MKKAVILSGVNWNTTKQRHHTIAEYLKEMNYDVVFVEGITSSKFQIKKLLQRLKSSLKRKSNKVINPTNGVKVVNYRFINPMGSFFYMYNKIKANRLIQELDGDIEILINYLPINTTSYIIREITYERLIYDCVRDFQNWGGYPSDIKKHESELVEIADVIFTDSYYLTDKMKKSTNHSKDVIQILPTVSLDSVKALDKCIVKEKIQKIVYFGQLGNHIDTLCLKKLAEVGYEIYIIGDITVTLDFPHKYLGYFSDQSLLGEVIAEHADAIIIPYKGNMDGVIPAKLMQSFATGLPIYVNSFYDSTRLEKYLYVYSNMEELLKKIADFDIIKHESQSIEMKKFAKNNLLENQFAKLSRYMTYE